jgi:pilus assembly protein Flp/PilA
VADRPTNLYAFCQQTLTEGAAAVAPPTIPGMDTTPREDPLPDQPEVRDPEQGQGMVEYALIIVLVAIGALIALQVVGHATNNLYSNITNSIGP